MPSQESELKRVVLDPTASWRGAPELTAPTGVGRVDDGVAEIEGAGRRLPRPPDALISSSGSHEGPLQEADVTRTPRSPAQRGELDALRRRDRGPRKTELGTSACARLADLEGRGIPSCSSPHGVRRRRRRAGPVDRARGAGFCAAPIQDRTDADAGDGGRPIQRRSIAASPSPGAQRAVSGVTSARQVADERRGDATREGGVVASPSSPKGRRPNGSATEGPQLRRGDRP